MKENTIPQVLDTDDPLDIRKDHVFKAVFMKETPEARESLSRLVSALIDTKITIESIWANEEPIYNIGDRKIRFDINCRAVNGERINVEMSFDPKPYEPVRMEFYTGRLFTSQEISGINRDYNDLKRTYQITILANKSLFPDNEFFHSFEYYDPVRCVSLNGRTKIITLELTKLEKIASKPTSEMNEPESWAFFFEYLTDRRKRDKINEILKKEKGISMANKVLITISRNEIERMRILSEEKYLLDRQSEIAYERKAGREERDKEIARNALAKGSSLDFVSEITGLDIETIKNL
jgi:predicted transposase/invertase (TIGR01784 family)